MPHFFGFGPVAGVNFPLGDNGHVRGTLGLDIRGVIPLSSKIPVDLVIQTEPTVNFPKLGIETEPNFDVTNKKPFSYDLPARVGFEAEFKRATNKSPLHVGATALIGPMWRLKEGEPLPILPMLDVKGDLHISMGRFVGGPVASFEFYTDCQHNPFQGVKGTAGWMWQL